jgi:hypothetical protein
MHPKFSTLVALVIIMWLKPDFFLFLLPSAKADGNELLIIRKVVAM